MIKKLTYILLLVASISYSQSTVLFSSYCSGCQGNATTALQNAFNAMSNGDTFEFDTDSTLTYLIGSSAINVPRSGTYNFHNALIRKSNGATAQYGDFYFSANYMLINDFSYDGNKDNVVDSGSGFGVMSAIALNTGQGHVWTNFSIINTRQMAFAGNTLTGVVRFIDGYYENIGEHVNYFAEVASGANLLWSGIYCKNFATADENFNASRNVEFTKIPSGASSETATFKFENLTFEQTYPTAAQAVYPMLKSNTIFEGEIWDNIEFTANSQNIWGLYLTEEPVTLTIRNSNFRKNEIFYGTVNRQGGNTDNYCANCDGHEIGNVVNIENTTASLNRVSTGVNSWIGGTMYLSKPWYGDTRMKRNFTSDVLFECLDIVLDGNKFEYYDFSGNVTFNGCNFTVSSGTSGFDMGDNSGGTGTIRIKNSTINVPSATLFKNSYGGTINFISENTNTITSGTLTGSGFNSVTTNVASTGGVDCGVDPPVDPPVAPPTPVTGSNNYIFLIGN